MGIRIRVNASKEVWVGYENFLDGLVPTRMQVCYMARVYDNIYQGSVSKQWLEVYEYATMPNIHTVNFHVCLALYIVAV